MWNVGLLDFQNARNTFVREGMLQSQNEIEPNSIVVIDDEIQKDFTNMFTWVHHVPCFCVKITKTDITNV